jgi:hypothetical protein
MSSQVETVETHVGHATGGYNGTILDGTVDVPVKYPGAVLLRLHKYV